MVVLNFCSMQKNTKLFLEIKEKIEIEAIDFDKDLDESVKEQSENIVVSIDKDYDINLNKDYHSSKSKEMVDVNSSSE